jgi:bleomycin hydrolase
LKTLKKATADMIKGNHAVWFGCDVGKMLETKLGAMDLNIYDYEAVYGTKFQLDKAGRLEYEDSEMTHAMVITGVDLDEKGNSPPMLSYYSHRIVCVTITAVLFPGQV